MPASSGCDVSVGIHRTFYNASREAPERSQASDPNSLGDVERRNARVEQAVLLFAGKPLQIDYAVQRGLGMDGRTFIFDAGRSVVAPVVLNVEQAFADNTIKLLFRCQKRDQDILHRRTKSVQRPGMSSQLNTTRSNQYGRWHSAKTKYGATSHGKARTMSPRNEELSTRREAGQTTFGPCPKYLRSGSNQRRKAPRTQALQT